MDLRVALARVNRAVHVSWWAVGCVDVRVADWQGAIVGAVQEAESHSVVNRAYEGSREVWVELCSSYASPRGALHTGSAESERS